MYPNLEQIIGQKIVPRHSFFKTIQERDKLSLRWLENLTHAHSQGHFISTETELKALILEAWAEEFSIDPVRLEQLRSILSDIPCLELITPEIQGASDIPKEITPLHGVYVYSILTALRQLFESSRLNLEVLYALNSLIQAGLSPQLSSPYCKLVRSVLFELAFPEKIVSFYPEQYPAALAQTLLAVKEPAQYLEFSEGLAQAIALDSPDINTLGTTLSTRLIQPALMEFGNRASDLLNALLWDEGGYHQVRLKSAQALPEFLNTLYKQVSSGEPTPLCIQMAWNEPSVILLLLRIDQREHLVYFLNLKGESLHMPLASFENLLNQASQRPGLSCCAYILTHLKQHLEGILADAMTQWPGEAKQKSYFRPFPIPAYSDSWWSEHPEVLTQQNINPDLWQKLHEQVAGLRISRVEAFTRLHSLIQRSQHLERVVERILNFEDKDRLSNFLRLMDETERAIDLGLLPKEMGQRILEDQPERYLSTLQIDQLVEMIHQGKHLQVETLLGRMDSNKDHLIHLCQALGLAFSRVETWLDQGISFLELHDIFTLLQTETEVYQIARNFLGSLKDVRELRSLLQRVAHIQNSLKSGLIDEDSALKSLLYYQSAPNLEEEKI